MNCREFEAEWAGLDDTSKPTDEMETHRASCNRCAELIADLTSILEQARELRLSGDPPQRVWAAIHNQLEQEGLIREPAQSKTKARRALTRGWIFQALASGAVFSLALGVMYVHSLFNAQAPPILSVAHKVPELMPVDTSDRDKTVTAMVAKLPEDHREVFVSNWNQVNASINNWQAFADQHPDDTFAPQQLMNARQQKEQLWENLLRWDEF
jgi:hypothetical protein